MGSAAYTIWEQGILYFPYLPTWRLILSFMTGWHGCTREAAITRSSMTRDKSCLPIKKALLKRHARSATDTAQWRPRESGESWTLPGNGLYSLFIRISIYYRKITLYKECLSEWQRTARRHQSHGFFAPYDIAVSLFSHTAFLLPLWMTGYGKKIKATSCELSAAS